MNDRGSLIGIIGAWTGAGTAFLLHNMNTLLVAAATVCAMFASIYAWRVNRRKDRYLRAQDEHACNACRLTRNQLRCPYPKNERPADCWARQHERTEV